MELQAYADIPLPSKCTWLGLNYVVEVLPTQKN